MSDLVSYHLDDGVATLTLNNGKVNAISPDVIVAFNAALDQAEKDRAIVILTGQPGILSGGYDLKVMTSSAEAAIELVAQGSTLARRMLSHPFPIIVACPGPRGCQGCLSAAVCRLSNRCRRAIQYRLERGADRHDHAPRRHRTGARSPAQIGVQSLGDQRRDVRP
ncbi:enoyl-CoA hydratase/carnithine racemase [Pseudomonas sp. PvP046]